MENKKTKRKNMIGEIELTSPFILAPLAGITDSAFRRICKEQGASLVYSEMVSAKGLYYNDPSTSRLLEFDPTESPIAYQLFGADPAIMAWAVRRLSGSENCLIDVNMGCPVPKVAKNGEGSALMKEPELAARIITEMVNAEAEAAEAAGRPKKPITVKCRIGWDENSINILDFAARMEEAGAGAIAVHGRTREQHYSGSADWEKIAEVKEKVSIPVIGSGDVFSAEDACRMLSETGCDMVMIARGALGNPWIFEEAAALYEGRPAILLPSYEEKGALIAKHLGLVIREKGEKRAVLEMRKHLGWYIKGLPGAAEMRRRVNTVTTGDEMRSLIGEYFGQRAGAHFR
jgi:tRNA-dihydrouridine synthase B